MTTFGGLVRLALCALVADVAGGCAKDPVIQASDASDASDALTAVDLPPPGNDLDASDVDTRDSRSPNDIPANLFRDAAPPDAGVQQTEPPLTIPTCDGPSDEVCCRSAIGFDDGSTQHFLTPGCCRLALSQPTAVTTPTACGRGALGLDATFMAVNDASLCDTSAEATECSYRVGEVSRAVLTALDVTGLTMSVAIYLQGPDLPAKGVYGQLFFLGKNGLMDGPRQPIKAPGVWTAIEFPVPSDPTAPGANVRLIGVRVGFSGQAWTGRAYLDEISWH